MSIPAARAKELRRKHILWLIEHKPAASVLGESVAIIEKSGTPLSDPDAWAEADRLWRAKIAAGAPEQVFFNAINFYRPSDPAYAQKVADDGLAAYPSSVRLAVAKGGLLALTVLGVKQLDRFGQAAAFDDSILKSEAAARARRELAVTQNASILGGAADAFHQQDFPLTRRNRSDEAKKASDLTESLYLLAMELEPGNTRWRSGLAAHYWALGVAQGAARENRAAGKVPAGRGRTGAAQLTCSPISRRPILRMATSPRQPQPRKKFSR